MTTTRKALSCRTFNTLLLIGAVASGTGAARQYQRDSAFGVVKILCKW